MGVRVQQDRFREVTRLLIKFNLRVGFKLRVFPCVPGTLTGGTASMLHAVMKRQKMA